MKQLLTICGGFALLAGLAGCITLDDPGASAAEQEDIRMLREDLNRVKGQMETVEMENRRMANAVEKLRAAAADPRDQAALQERLDNLERQLQAVNAAREKDKQAIVDQISSRIAEIMSKGAGRPTPTHSAPATPRPAPAASPEGATSAGEHIVKPGETLSSIAAIYKIKTGALIEANDIKDQDNLRAGQKLVIPR